MEEPIEVRCSNCGHPLRPDEDVVIQIRSGYINEEGEFIPDHDVGLFCSECE